MDRCTRSRAAPWLGCLPLLLLVAAPAAAEEEPEALRPLDAYWAGRLAEAAERVEATRERLASAEAAYSRARRDDRPRGEALQKLIDERKAAERAHARAKAQLPELVEQARRAGVVAEVLRPYWNGAVVDDGTASRERDAESGSFRDPRGEARPVDPGEGTPTHDLDEYDEPASRR